MPMLYPLIGTLGVVAVGSFLLSPRVWTADGFYRGHSAEGRAPGIGTLILSQVATWIFARSLLNAAILGYYYGIAGTLAYAAYFTSFLTGAWIIEGIRFRAGAASIQEFLRAEYGALGTGCYNVVVAVRLLSEIFANLLVIGILFGAAGSGLYVGSILAVALVTLGYSMLGGLRASLRTDVFQMLVLLGVLAALLAQLLLADRFSVHAIVVSSADASGAGWVLLGVAALQVWSYPLHDPVMMDRGFVAGRDVTRRSFLHACWISVLCIIAFGLLGVHAGLHSAEGEALFDALGRLMGEPTMLLLSAALVLSAISTLDSTFASAAKLSVVDMRLGRPTVANGRIAMVGFLIGGLLLLFLASDDLFGAVALSGTASMFLAPVVLFNVWGRRHVARWALAVSFAAAIGGAALYFLESEGHTSLIGPVLGIEHKYSKLLAISAAVLIIGCGSFAAGLRRASELRPT